MTIIRSAIILFAQIVLNSPVVIDAELFPFSSNSLDINWTKVCQLLSGYSLILQPCEFLVSPNGTELTDEGKRVLPCMLSGPLGKSFNLSDDELKQIALMWNCLDITFDRDIIIGPTLPPANLSDFFIIPVLGFLSYL